MTGQDPWLAEQPEATQLAFQPVFTASRAGKACWLNAEQTMVVAAGLARIAGYQPGDVLPLFVVRQLREGGLIA